MKHGSIVATSFAVLALAACGKEPPCGSATDIGAELLPDFAALGKLPAGSFQCEQKDPAIKPGDRYVQLRFPSASIAQVRTTLETQITAAGWKRAPETPKMKQMRFDAASNGIVDNLEELVFSKSGSTLRLVALLNTQSKFLFHAKTFDCADKASSDAARVCESDQPAP